MRKELKTITMLLIVAAIMAAFLLAAEVSPASAEEPEVSRELPQSEQTDAELYDVPLEKELQEYIITEAAAKDIDPALVMAIIGTESNYNTHAVGDNGNSLGLMQIQKRFHESRMDKLQAVDLLDPYDNVKVGIDILSELLEEGSTTWALMAYNGGRSYADAMVERGCISEYAETVLKLTESIQK